MSLKDLNEFRHLPAFADLKDEDWLTTARTMFNHAKNLRIKDGVLYFAPTETSNEQTLQQRTQ
jgi:hypothetical protein